MSIDQSFSSSLYYSMYMNALIVVVIIIKKGLYIILSYLWNVKFYEDLISMYNN